ncbi:MAG: hypothetical protein FJY86_00730 [Candidatus Diapherotrites archaeon]|uniref:Uncharacterized protein n=1 Tax=Candidatus Iainarchaeum sp. TaxID=3101447 RepID=A0A8T4C7C7_9ARCH|nr:hypothetical protein [Candidatus Diapherotrites archaeon]
MKGIAQIIFILLIGVTGCIEGKLTPIETNECLLSTSTQQSFIPACETELECESKLNDFSPRKIFTHLSVGAEDIVARKKINTAWKAITKASKAIDQVHESCSTMKVESILPRAMQAASEIQWALKASEEAQRQTYQALEKAIREAEKQQLVEIKDTKAYESYADLAKKYQEITTGNSVSEWGAQQENTINYFENIVTTILGAKKNPYQITWNTLFDVYKTGVQIQAKNDARGIIALSPLWQGALVSINGKKESSKALQLIGKIRANETLTHIEQVVGPENGIISSIWSSIRRLEDELRTLKEDEKKRQITMTAQAAVLREKWEKVSENDSEWKVIEKEMNAWLKSTGKIVLPTETISENEIIAIESETNELITAGNENTTPIGMRIKKWRNLERKITQLEQKIENREKQNENRDEVCLEIMNKISAQEQITANTPCLEAFANVLSQNTLLLDEKNRSKEIQMQECVKKLNQWERALGVEATPREWFEYYSGIESEASCENANTNAKWSYENSEHAKEMSEQKKRLNEIRKILQLAATDFPNEEESIHKNIQKIVQVTELSNPLTREEWSKKKNEWNIVENEVKKEATRYLQKLSEHAAWKLTNTEEVIIGKKINASVEGILFAHTREKIDFVFVVSIPNPGLTNVITIGNNRTIIDGENIIIEGESIPAGGVQLRGEGSVWGARATKENTYAEVFGHSARLEKTAIIETNFYPIQAEWEPSKEYDGGIVQFVENDAQIIFPEKNKIILSLNEKQSSTRAVIEVPSAILIETAVSSTEKLDRKIIQNYLVHVKNQLTQKIVATAYSGVNGDPHAVENVAVINENGDAVSVTLDASGNIILREQVLLAKQTRSYFIRIEKEENDGEFSANILRLTGELEQLLKNNHSVIVTAAQKIMNNLIRTQNEKNVLTKEMQLIKIQNDVSQLIMQAHEKDEEWSYLVNEWEKIKTKSAEQGLSDELLLAGEEAVQKMDEQKLRSIIANTQQRQTTPEKVKTTIKDDEKLTNATKALSEVRKLVEEYEKSTKIGCEKLIQVNFVCPLTNEIISQFKKDIASYEKIVEKMVSKKEKLSTEKLSEEWTLVESDWIEKQAITEKISIELIKALREMRNDSTERINILTIEAERSGKDEVVEANEKAQQALKNGEYGKSIYISQNVLNYLNSNKITGFSALPNEVWPLMGVIILVGGWIGFNEWKKKKIVEIEWKKIPRIINPAELNNQPSVSAPPTTQEVLPKSAQTKAWTKNPMRRETFEKTEEQVLPKGRNK